MGRKITIENVHDFCKTIGWKCLETEYICRVKMDFKCSNNHHVSMAFNNLKDGGYRCAVCSGKARLTIENVHEFCKDKPFKCTSTTYKNNKSKLQFKCKKNHVWKATFNSIKHKGSGCLICSGKAKHTIENVHDFCNDKTFSCTSLTYKNNSSNLNFKCEKNHEWKATFGNIQNGTGCPICCRQVYSKKAIRWLKSLGIRDLMHAENGGEFSFKYYDPQNGKKRTYKVDGYSPSLNCVYEFHGNFWHGNPSIYNHLDINPINKKRFGTLLNATIKKELICKLMGFNYVCLWG